MMAVYMAVGSIDQDAASESTCAWTGSRSERVRIRELYLIGAFAFFNAEYIRRMQAETLSVSDDELRRLFFI